MEARFSIDGDSVEYTPAVSVAAGEVIIDGKLVGVSKLTIAANARGSLATKGVFEVVKDGAAAISFSRGDDVFWNATTSLATKTNAGGAVKIGLAVSAAANADTEVRTLLGQG